MLSRKYPYFDVADKQFQMSVRYNLSIQPQFIKTSSAKGSTWTISGEELGENEDKGFYADLQVPGQDNTTNGGDVSNDQPDVGLDQSYGAYDDNLDADFYPPEGEKTPFCFCFRNLAPAPYKPLFGWEMKEPLALWKNVLSFPRGFF